VTHEAANVDTPPTNEPIKPALVERIAVSISYLLNWTICDHPTADAGGPGLTFFMRATAHAKAVKMPRASR
jgi:hypothetical protein